MPSSRFLVASLTQGFLQSGHSLHEHSYKIDADLSEIGWEYAAQLKDFVLERRAKSLKERGLDPKTSRLVVRSFGLLSGTYDPLLHLQIWTSARRRSHHTAWPFMAAADPKQPGGAQCKVKVIEKPQMSEINPGVWDGLTVADAKREYPEEWERFVKDPYTFRAPRAESYHDLSGTFFISVWDAWICHRIESHAPPLSPLPPHSLSPIGADVD
jgi:6-phosphofructo-2-kinase/fructose-2,6-biphosphatase 4